ncbi:hypothetical protein DICVIV_00306 [Dictyocaulus viviparus]|uniref:Uncharacterized protein n=1 Tax=Dictyocaulus viviparus TaxID=29172 RepID=A0A0D8YFX2_DICVI|nr:hypothetical protein DICVIV_00306 [Dictyocaulus viviparus]
MVSPSCGLEYQPTAAFWGILLFIVFPFIYLTGKVVGTLLTVLLRVLRGLCRFLLWDDDDYEEEMELLKLQQQAIPLNKKYLMYKLQKDVQREKKRADLVVKECADTNEKITSLLKKNSRNDTADCMPPSDISDSLNSECNTTDVGIVPPPATHNDKHVVAANGTCVPLCDQGDTCKSVSLSV